MLTAVPCPNQGACTGGANSCNEGHTGFLCSQCLKGYFNNGTIMNATCSQCHATPSILLFKLLFLHVEFFCVSLSLAF